MSTVIKILLGVVMAAAIIYALQWIVAIGILSII